MAGRGSASARGRRRRARRRRPASAVRLPQGRPTPTGSSSSASRSLVGVGGVFFLFWAMNRARRPAARALPRGRAAVRVHRPAARDPARLPHLPGHQHDPHQLQGRAAARSFVGLDNYEFVFTDESMLRSMRNTAGWIILVPLVAVSVGLAVRHAGRPAAPRRGRRQVADLPADGDLVRRRRGHVPADLQLPPAGLRHEHRAAQRRSGRASATSRSPWLSRAAVEQPAPDGDHGLDADRVRHGRAVGGHQGDPRRDHRGRPHRRRVGAAGVPARSSCRASSRRSSW